MSTTKCIKKVKGKVKLTVLLLCSAAIAKPKAMRSRIKTAIKSNLEAMDIWS